MSGSDLAKNLHAAQSDDDDDDDDEETTDMSKSGTNGHSLHSGGGGNNSHPDESELKKRKKLELNRIASRESRKRKKRRVEELQRSVLFLTHENHQLREQNELLRQMLVGRLPSATSAVVGQAAMVSTATGNSVPTPGVDPQSLSTTQGTQAPAQPQPQQQPQQVQVQVQLPQGLSMPQPTPPPLPPAQHYASHHLMPQLGQQVPPPQLLSGLTLMGGKSE